MLGTYPLSTLPISTLEAVVVVEPPEPTPSGGGGGWYAPRRREPPRPPKTRQPSAYSVSIGCSTAAPGQGSVSFAIDRTLAIDTNETDASTGSISFTISRYVSIGRSAAVSAYGHCTAEIVRDPIPERPIDTRLAAEFARRASPLDIDGLICAMRRGSRRLSADLESGTITSNEWSKEMSTLIRSAHVASAVAGRGDINVMRSGDWQRVDAAIDAAQVQVNASARLARVRCFAVVASRSRRLADGLRTSHAAAELAFRTESAQ